MLPNSCKLFNYNQTGCIVYNINVTGLVTLLSTRIALVENPVRQEQWGTSSLAIHRAGYEQPAWGYRYCVITLLLSR